MSVAPHAGVIDYGTFTPPTESLNGIQGEVPQPLIGQENYVLTGKGWSSLGALGTITYQGTWDAATNTPTLTSSVGTQGYYYVVSLAGTTDLNGITTWDAGDWAIFNGSTWQKIEGGATGTFTNVITPSVTAPTNNLTLSAISTGAVKFNTETANQVQITDATAASGQYTLLSRDNAGNEQRVSATSPSGGVNLGLSSAVAGAVKFYTNGFSELQAQISRNASAVNYVQVTGGATGNATTISAQGSDANIFMQFYSKGSNGFNFYSGNGTGRQLRIDGGVTSSINFLGIQGATTGQTPILSASAQSSDTNVSLALQSKGTGAIDLAAGSSGVNISNGGTVTAITKTANGTAYTSFPSIAISAPTTAGGVQAVLGITNMTLNNFPTAIQNGGTGYTVGDVITLVGGTPQAGAGTFTVATVSGGVITSIGASSNFARYITLPTNPVSVTGGTGAGALITASWVVGDLAVTTAGSGYIEQPTVTFSGGGGSGAAAYASVGGNTTQKTIGNIHTFATPNSNVLAIVDKNAAGNFPTNTTVAFSMIPPQSSFGASFLGFGTQAYLGTTSTSSNAFTFATSVSSPVSNGGGGSAQFNIAHTASAVNYVQVTGGATNVAAVISSQGSDGNVILQLQSKGTAAVSLATNGVKQFDVFGNAGSVNFIRATGNTSGNAPSFNSVGTDTNIDLLLNPKGTGRVRFGTYTGTILTPTGYIEVLDSGGTLRRLLVG
jgi:hypothetical protein